ncbi:hypothetical protein BH10ACI2_BH10ACI2_15050 [soil metagenome]
MSDDHTSRSRETVDLRIRTGALVWMCAAQFFVAQAVVQAAWTTPFSLATNYISDLGNTVCANYPVGGAAYVCSPLYVVMNISFFLQGVIIVVGTLLLMPLMRWGLTKRVVSTLLLLTGFGMLGVGFFPENVNNDWHVYSAALQFITGNLALVVLGASRIVAGANTVQRMVSILLGVTGLAASGLFPNGYHFGFGVGGMERVAAYTFPIWLICAGLLIIIRMRKKAEATPAKLFEACGAQ